MEGLKRRTVQLPVLLLSLLLLAACTGGTGPPDPSSPAESSKPVSGTVSGTVLDDAGKPVDGATVLFTVSPVAVPDIAALTDREGKFSLGAPAPGHYEILVNAAGYAEQRVDAEVGAGAEVELRIELKR